MVAAWRRRDFRPPVCTRVSDVRGHTSMSLFFLGLRSVKYLHGPSQSHRKYLFGRARRRVRVRFPPQCPSLSFPPNVGSYVGAISFPGSLPAAQVGEPGCIIDVGTNDEEVLGNSAGCWPARGRRDRRSKGALSSAACRLFSRRDRTGAQRLAEPRASSGCSGTSSRAASAVRRAHRTWLPKKFAAGSLGVQVNRSSIRPRRNQPTPRTAGPTTLVPARSPATGARYASPRSIWDFLKSKPRVHILSVISGKVGLKFEQIDGIHIAAISETASTPKGPSGSARFRPALMSIAG